MTEPRHTRPVQCPRNRGRPAVLPLVPHAEPGQVLVSQSVAEAGSPEGVSLVEAGAVQLKGFPRPVMLFEACRI
jgi:hypothetical protein